MPPAMVERHDTVSQEVLTFDGSNFNWIRQLAALHRAVFVSSKWFGTLVSLLLVFGLICAEADPGSNNAPSQGFSLCATTTNFETYGAWNSVIPVVLLRNRHSSAYAVRTNRPSNSNMRPALDDVLVAQGGLG